MIERGGVTLLLTMRLLPIVPFSLISIAAGTARVPLWRYTWTTAVGYAPITAIAVYLGTKLEGFSFEDPTVLLGIGGLLALIGVAHWLLPRRGEQAAGETKGLADPGLGVLDPACEWHEMPRPYLRKSAALGRWQSGRRPAGDDPTTRSAPD